MIKIYCMKKLAEENTPQILSSESLYQGPFSSLSLQCPSTNVAFLLGLTLPDLSCSGKTSFSRPWDSVLYYKNLIT